MSFILSALLEPCGSSQKKMKGVTLLKSLVSLTLQQFFSSCVAMDDLHMCRAVEQEQFNTWCTTAAIATGSRRALYFTSYAGALREAGRAVADGLDRRASRAWLPGGAGFLHVSPVASLFCSSASHLVFTFCGQAYTDFICWACPARVCAGRAPVWCVEGCRLFVPPGLAWSCGDADASPFGTRTRVPYQLGPLLGVALREDGSGYGEMSGAHLDGPPEIHGTLGPSVGWMTRNLWVPLALSEAATPAPVCLGQGQAQAAALEPGMVSPRTLEEASPPTTDGGAGCASAGGPCFCGAACAI